MDGYQPVVFAVDLPECDWCGETWCPKHNLHLADCECIGPTETGGVEYIEADGILYGRRNIKGNHQCC